MRLTTITGHAWSRLGGPSLALTLCLGGIGGMVFWQGFRQSRAHSDRREAEAWLRRQGSSLQPRFIAAQVISETLGASIALNPRLTIADFHRFAEQTLRHHRDALTLQLSPGGRIAAQYPRGGGPQIGLNLLTSPSNRQASQLALRRGTSVSQGPFRLVQGGQRLVIRTPVVLGGSRRFWGFCDILLDWDALTADLAREARASGFQTQMRVVDANGRRQQSPGFPTMERAGEARLSLPLPGGELVIHASRVRPPLQRHGEDLLIGLLGLGVTGSTTLAVLRSHRSRHQAQRDARHLRHATVRAMAIVARTHDDETGAHLERCARYAEVLGRQLQAEGLLRLSDADLEALSVAVTLHDIGKVGIPDAIFKKPGRLTAAEQVSMRLHAQIGFNILDRLSQEIELHERLVFDLAKDLALCHHENWDGSGYPRGLSAEAIPLAARIMAILDVYDGLASKRCYKPALPHGQVVSRIAALAGTKFDPYLVQAFLKVSGTFRQILEEHPDQEVPDPSRPGRPAAEVGLC